MLLVVALAAVAVAQGSSERVTEPVDSAQQSYGHLFIEGSPVEHEFFRASFGGLIPCGSRQLAWMPDRFGCEYVRQPVVAARFAVALRGVCNFATKAAYAEKAGAHGLIVINSEGGLMRMPLGNRTLGEDNLIRLPSVMVRHDVASVLDVSLRHGVNLTAALRPFRAECTPDDEYHPYKRMAERLMPASPEARARGVRSPFVIPPPGPTDWAPRLAQGVRISVSRAAPSDAAVMANVIDARSPDSVASADREEEPLMMEGMLAMFGGVVAGQQLPLIVASPADACAVNLSNAGEVAGHAVVIQRGTCPMIDKARAAQAANASAVIIISNDQTDLASSVSSSSSLPPLEAIGLAQPAPDDHPLDVTVPTMLVLQRSGEALLAAMQRLGADARVTLQAVPIEASVWEDLRGLARHGEAYWPTDPAARERKIVQLVRANSEHSASGSPTRHALLRALVLRSGAQASRALRAVEAQLVFGPDGTDAGHPSDAAAAAAAAALHAPAVHSMEPATAFLIRRMPATALSFSGASDPLACRTEAGLFHTRVPDFQPHAASAVTHRIVDGLRAHACIEKLMLHSAHAIGGYLNLLRAEEPPEAWARLTGGVLRRYGFATDDEAKDAADAFIAVHRAVDRVQRTLARSKAPIDEDDEDDDNEAASDPHIRGAMAAADRATRTEDDQWARMRTTLGELLAGNVTA